MPLQDLMSNLDTQIKEHNDAKAALDTGVAALEEMRKSLQQKTADLDTESAKEKAELEDVRTALQAIRDEADRQLTALAGTTGGATTTQAGGTTAPTPPAAAPGGEGPQTGKSNRLPQNK